eukprot:6980237-Lingulodinium_polyedra.AAC.1
MTRSNRTSAATTARKSHARVPCEQLFAGVRGRAIYEPPWRRTLDSTASLCSVLQTLRNDA